MASGTQVRATFDDLYREKEKAELIRGKVVWNVDPKADVVPRCRQPFDLGYLEYLYAN
jgi:hypothetical protein